MSKQCLGKAESLLAVGESSVLSHGKSKFILYRLSDGYFATSHQCTHLFKSLGNGVIASDSLVRCPLHRAEFDIRTGDVVKWACFPKGVVNVINAVRKEKSLESYPVSIVDDEVWVELPEST